MKDTSGKNNYLELLRFLFAVILVFHHSGFVAFDGIIPFPSGAIVADTFYIITGFFLMKHLSREYDITSPLFYSVKYTFNKIKKLFPYALFGTTLAYILDIIRMPEGSVFENYIEYGFTYICELFFLPMTGIMKLTDSTSIHNAPLWFISAMLIALPFVMYIAIKAKKAFSFFLSWLLPLVIYSYLIVNYGDIVAWISYTGIVYTGVLRAFAGICLGCFGFSLVEKVSRCGKDMENLLTKILLTVLELALFALAIRNMYKGVNGYLSLYTLFSLFGMLMLTLSGKTFTSKLQFPFFAFLGKLSMPMFCIHWAIYKWLGSFFGYFGKYPCIILNIILCILSYFLIQFIRKLAGKNAKETGF